MTDIVLYDGAGTPSPRRVKLCLIEKGLPFKIKWLNLGLMDQKSPEYLKISPTGLVPALVHKGRAFEAAGAVPDPASADSDEMRIVLKDDPAQAAKLVQDLEKAERAKAAGGSIEVVKLRRFALTNRELARKITELEQRYDGQFEQVFDALRALLSRAAAASSRRRTSAAASAVVMVGITCLAISNSAAMPGAGSPSRNSGRPMALTTPLKPSAACARCWARTSIRPCSNHPACAPSCSKA